MLLTRRMETAGYGPLGFIATDYALGAWSVKPVIDHRPLFSPDILEHEFVEWVQRSHLLKRDFREVALIGGLLDRQHPGQRKSGRQLTFSPALFYDFTRRSEPHTLMLHGASRWVELRVG